MKTKRCHQIKEKAVNAERLTAGRDQDGQTSHFIVLLMCLCSRWEILFCCFPDASQHKQWEAKRKEEKGSVQGEERAVKEKLQNQLVLLGGSSTHVHAQKHTPALNPSLSHAARAACRAYAITKEQRGVDVYSFLSFSAPLSISPSLSASWKYGLHQPPCRAHSHTHTQDFLFF